MLAAHNSPCVYSQASCRVSSNQLSPRLHHQYRTPRHLQQRAQAAGGNGSATEGEEADGTAASRNLQRCNTLQQSCLRRDSHAEPLQSISCFAEDNLPKHHTSR